MKSRNRMLHYAVAKLRPASVTCALALLCGSVGSESNGKALGDQEFVSDSLRLDVHSIAAPGLSFASYLGGFGNESGNAMALDGVGNIYVVGMTWSFTFPVVAAVQPTKRGAPPDAFITKLDPTGRKVLYSSYLGGTGIDEALDVAVDGAGNVYVSGWTTSVDFPVLGAVQATFGGHSDAFLLSLDASGNLRYSSYLGGAGLDSGYGVAVDAAGAAYLVGTTMSQPFPVVAALKAVHAPGDVDGFLSKFVPSGGSLEYSTLLGGSDQDGALAVAVNAAGEAVVSGDSFSGFPTVNALQAKSAGFKDAFVAKLSADGQRFLFSTYLGGSGDEAFTRLALAANGRILLAGATRSVDFPVVRPTQSGHAGMIDAFVSVLSPDGSVMEFSTLLGGSSGDFAYGIAATESGHVVVTGPTYSTDLPIVAATQSKLGGVFDAFIAEIDPDTASVAFASYLGGSADDDNANMGAGIATGGCGRIYVTGNTNSDDFPVTADAFQSKYQDNGVGSPDAFVVRLSRASIDCPAPVTLECPQLPQPAATGSPTTAGMCAPATCDWVDAETNSCGASRVISRSWSCSDGIETLSCSQEIRVLDTTPPLIDSVALDGACLWPPNHWFWCADDISAFVSATDACDAVPPVARVLSCKSSQPADAIGDGNSGPDCLLVDGGRGVCLRAERSGLDPLGRTYTLELEVADACGNASPASARVTVPHDQAPEASCLRPTRREGPSRRRR